MKGISLRRISPVSVSRVEVDDVFWAPRIENNRKVTLPSEYNQLKKTGRINAWKLDWKPGIPNEPHIFWDSDVAKWLEAVAYSLMTNPDKKLAKRVDGVIAMIEKAQQPDGYLNPHFTVVEPDKRWVNLYSAHELYSAGHLMEAAVAYYEATRKRKFLDIMCRYADYIDKVFGPKKGQKRGYPGHEEIELALVKLYRTTGKERYLRLGKYFIDERGRQPHYFDIEARARGEEPGGWYHGKYDSHQAHLPVREQTTAEGHAVRALYLYSGMADIAAETSDRTLLNACKTLWKNITQRRMYIIGAVGPTRHGERFTFDYDLPNETAYAETCANIALVFFAHRMLQIEADGQYADVMERALYNGVLSGVSLDGKRFFYANPLGSYPGVNPNKPERAGGVHYRRSEWFGCACCPPNIARLISSFGGYIYSQGANEVWVHLYVGGRTRLKVGSQTVMFEQRTEYPRKEEIRISVTPDVPSTFTLALRIPGWCRSPALKVNGKAIAVTTKKGYIRVRREWRKDDKVDLFLPMPVERIGAHPKARQNCGRIALQRGPVVYCLEEADNGKDLNDLILPHDSKLRAKFEPELLGGVVIITGRARRRDVSDWKDHLYRPAGSRIKMKNVEIRAIPYALWANRKEGEMLVWIRAG